MGIVWKYSFKKRAEKKKTQQWHSSTIKPLAQARECGREVGRSWWAAAGGGEEKDSRRASASGSQAAPSAVF